MPICPKCGQPNAEGQPICRECGADLPRQSPESPQAEADRLPPEDVQANSLETELSPTDQEILRLLREGKKIAAIKVYRAATDADLRDSKEAVEAMAVQHGVESKATGCAGVVLLGALGLGASLGSLLA